MSQKWANLCLLPTWRTWVQLMSVVQCLCCVNHVVWSARVPVWLLSHTSWLCSGLFSCCDGGCSPVMQWTAVCRQMKTTGCRTAPSTAVHRLLHPSTSMARIFSCLCGTLAQQLAEPRPSWLRGESSKTTLHQWYIQQRTGVFQ